MKRYLGIVAYQSQASGFPSGRCFGWSFALEKMKKDRPILIILDSCFRIWMEGYSVEFENYLRTRAIPI